MVSNAVSGSDGSDFGDRVVLLIRSNFSVWMGGWDRHGGMRKAKP